MRKRIEDYLEEEQAIIFWREGKRQFGKDIARMKKKDLVSFLANIQKNKPESVSNQQWKQQRTFAKRFATRDGKAKGLLNRGLISFLRKSPSVRQARAMERSYERNGKTVFVRPWSSPSSQYLKSTGDRKGSNIIKGFRTEFPGDPHTDESILRKWRRLR